jgi:hypothetical protein
MSSSSTNPRWSAKNTINDFLKYGEFDKLFQACNDLKEQEAIQRMRILDNRHKGLPVDENLALAADKTTIEYIQLEEYVDKYLASSGPITRSASASAASEYCSCTAKGHCSLCLAKAVSGVEAIKAGTSDTTAVTAAQKLVGDTKFKYVLTHHAQKMVDKKKKDDDELKDSLQRIEAYERIADSMKKFDYN